MSFTNNPENNANYKHKPVPQTRNRFEGLTCASMGLVEAFKRPPEDSKAPGMVYSMDSHFQALLAKVANLNGSESSRLVIEDHRRVRVLRKPQNGI